MDFGFFLSFSKKPGPVEHTWARLEIIQSDLFEYSFFDEINAYNFSALETFILLIDLLILVYWSYRMDGSVRRGSHSTIQFGDGQNIATSNKLPIIYIDKYVCVHIRMGTICAKNG